ncbi:hypothetical protein FB451DRAFT_1180140 [Mycena latifolia]|nr:hypothetical protein FB451DRAFT_1180140 [Mycena latifolia]
MTEPKASAEKAIVGIGFLAERRPGAQAIARTHSKDLKSLALPSQELSAIVRGLWELHKLKEINKVGPRRSAPNQDLRASQCPKGGRAGTSTRIRMSSKSCKSARAENKGKPSKVQEFQLRNLLSETRELRSACAHAVLERERREGGKARESRVTQCTAEGRPKTAVVPIRSLPPESENGRRLDAAPTTTKILCATFPPSAAIISLHNHHLALTSLLSGPLIYSSAFQFPQFPLVRLPMPCTSKTQWITQRTSPAGLHKLSGKSGRLERRRNSNLVKWEIMNVQKRVGFLVSEVLMGA